MGRDLVLILYVCIDCFLIESYIVSLDKEWIVNNMPDILLDTAKTNALRATSQFRLSKPFVSRIKMR